MTLGFALGAVLGTACASQPAQLATPVAVASANAVPTATQSPVAEAQPVAAEPQDLVVVGRIRHPGPFLNKLGDWAGFPVPWEETLAERYPQLQSVLLLDTPVDVAVALEPEAKGMPDIYAVFSLGLTDYDAGVNALTASGEPLSVNDAGQQVVRLEGKLECTVARANGVARARLVCGKGLEALAAFAATNLAQQAVGDDDVYAEVRLVPIQQRYGKKAQMLKMGVPILLREASLQNARFDSALATAAHATVADLLVLVDELDKVKLTVDLRDDTQTAQTELQVLYRGSQSFLPGLAVHGSQNAGSAPAMFWTLPAASSSASFTATSTPYDRMLPMSNTLGELMAGALEHFGLASGQVDTWMSEFKALLVSGGASVFAHVTTRPVTGAPKNLADAVGYDVMGVEGEQGALARWVEASVRLFNDKRFRTELTQRVGEELKQVPLVAVKNVPASAGLPKGAKLYSMVLPEEPAKTLTTRFLGPSATATPAAATVSLATAESGGRTWLVWGMDEKQVLPLLKQVVDANAAGSLAAEAGLQRWRTASVNNGASLRLRDVFTPSLLGDNDWLSPQEIANVSRAMPNGGRDFLHIEGVSNKEGPRTVLRVLVPKTALEDVAAAMVSLISAH